MRNNKVNEYNYKTPFHQAKARIYINGKEKGKSPEQIKKDMNNFFAKRQAISDINNDRQISKMSKHDKAFNRVITDDTFRIDFRELDDYDPFYDDFSRNNKSMEGDRDFIDENYNNINETRDWDKWEEEWDRRKNSEFGKLLQKLEKEMFEMFGEYDEYGCKTTPITYTVMAYYDGAKNLNKIVSSLEYTFENYDMLHHPHIKRIFNKLHKLANDNSSMNESLKSSNNKNNIKIAFIPHDDIDPIDDLYDITDIEFLNIAATKGKIYNLKDFEFAYNNLMFKYNHHNYYVRVIM
jgi:hypothetical protein